jgi:hypothetical protein
MRQAALDAKKRNADERQIKKKGTPIPLPSPSPRLVVTSLFIRVHLGSLFDSSVD